MRSVGVKSLKDNLSHYLRLAAAGETVLVTDRDRVIAEIHPSEHRPDSALDSVLADAVKKGWLSPALDPRFPLLSGKSVAPLAEILKDLAADRDER